MKYNEDIVKIFRQSKYDSLKWSKEENATITSRIYRDRIFSYYLFTFSNALLLALRKSVFGCYLNILNPQQDQDEYLNENKLPITEYMIKKLKGDELKAFEDKNRLLEDSTGILKTLIHENKTVDMKDLEKTIESLRLNDFYINQMDSLKSFLNLRILILISNNITDLPGAHLPRNLQFLELYDNFISDLENVVKKAPKRIMHLGLGRNKLDDGQMPSNGELDVPTVSSYHLLVESRNFTRLRSLDLSGNDIYTLETVLKALRDLESLKTLQLEGNPCYVASYYKNAVLTHFPELTYLDNTEISAEDRQANDYTHNENIKPQIIFHCHRIMGLRPPPRDAKSIQTIHIELELPLLEEVHLEKNNIEKTINVPDRSSKKIQTLDEDKSSKKNLNKSNRKKSKLKTAIKASPYEKPNEYDAQLEDNNFSFKTARMPWKDIIEFSPVFIESPEHDLMAIRDTFRSNVKVKVVYLKVSPFSKADSTKRKKWDTLKKYNTKQTVTPEGESTETIMKKVTLYTFSCDLKSVNWSDETVDYYWADHPKIGNEALRMDGCLKNLTYSKDVREKKTKEVINNNHDEDQKIIQPIPKMCTCQVGFGLKRN